MPPPVTQNTGVMPPPPGYAGCKQYAPTSYWDKERSAKNKRVRNCARAANHNDDVNNGKLARAKGIKRWLLALRGRRLAAYAGVYRKYQRWDNWSRRTAFPCGNEGGCCGAVPPEYRNGCMAKKRIQDLAQARLDARDPEIQMFKAYVRHMCAKDRSFTLCGAAAAR